MPRKLFSLKNVTLIFVLFITINACAASSEPQYRMRTIREAPASLSGQQCLNQCDSNRYQCEAGAKNDLDRCEFDRQARDVDCQRQARNARNYCLQNNSVACDLSYSNTLHSCRASIPSCRLDTSSCRAMGDTCFQRCGGTIRRERECVKNCDAQPGPPPAAYAVCKKRAFVSIAKKYPGGRPLRNKFCDADFCSTSGIVLEGPDQDGRCLINPELRPARRDWVAYELLTLD